MNQNITPIITSGKSVGIKSPAQKRQPFSFLAAASLPSFRVTERSSPLTTIFATSPLLTLAANSLMLSRATSLPGPSTNEKTVESISSISMAQTMFEKILLLFFIKLHYIILFYMMISNMGRMKGLLKIICVGIVVVGLIASYLF